MKQSRFIKVFSLSVAVLPLFNLDCFVPRNDKAGMIDSIPRNDNAGEIASSQTTAFRND
jgi:hypothetical protein